MRLYYNNGQGLNLTLVEDDGNEITFVVNRLKAVTPGCQVCELSPLVDDTNSPIPMLLILRSLLCI